MQYFPTFVKQLSNGTLLFHLYTDEKVNKGFAILNGKGDITVIFTEKMNQEDEEIAEKENIKNMLKQMHEAIFTEDRSLF